MSGWADPRRCLNRLIKKIVETIRGLGALLTLLPDPDPNPPRPRWFRLNHRRRIRRSRPWFATTGPPDPLEARSPEQHSKCLGATASIAFVSLDCAGESNPLSDNSLARISASAAVRPRRGHREARAPPFLIPKTRAPRQLRGPAGQVFTSSGGKSAMPLISHVASFKQSQFVNFSRRDHTALGFSSLADQVASHVDLLRDPPPEGTIVFTDGPDGDLDRWPLVATLFACAGFSDYRELVAEWCEDAGLQARDHLRREG
jgi:hypothetical protein